MKIEGKVGNLRRMLEKTSGDALFEPISFKLLPEDKKIISRLAYEGMQCGAFLEFVGFGLDADEDERLITLNGKKLLKQIGPLPDGANFTAEEKDGRLVINTPREKIHFPLQIDEGDAENYMDTMPLEVDDGRISLKSGDNKLTFETALQTSSTEFREIVSRMNLSDAEFVTLQENDGDMKAKIGSLTGKKVIPRDYNFEAEVMENEGGNDEVTIAVGVEEISKVLQDEIEIHYSAETPVVFYDQSAPSDDGGSGYIALYIISPAEDVE